MWAKAGQTVVGVDINESVVGAINERTMPSTSRSSIHFEGSRGSKEPVARMTPCEGDAVIASDSVDPLKKVCDMKPVQAAVESVCPYSRKGNLVSRKHSAASHLSRFVTPLIESLQTQGPEDVLLAHCPERILPGDIFRDCSNDRLIGGVDEKSTAAAAECYAAFVKGTLYRTDDVTAELRS
jgi:UDP-N-acetyl-D-mannosaminuronic acid dehydrogenase